VNAVARVLRPVVGACARVLRVLADGGDLLALAVLRFRKTIE
jgi:hypothetical protein